ncbi:MAG TPA: enolase C-terminal domain-like protein, partial [Phycisphaeraceae bacterium]
QDAISDDIEIAVDANEAWSAAEAIRWVEELDRHNLSIAYLEDPLHRNDHGGLLDIKRHTGVKIAGHDYVTEPDHIESLLDMGALDYLRLPGTIDGALIWARLAKRYDIPLIAGNSLFELNVHLAVAFADQTDRIEFADLAWNRLPAHSVTVRDGFMHASQTPGHGLAPNLDMLEQIVDNNPTPAPGNVASKA